MSVTREIHHERVTTEEITPNDKKSHDVVKKFNWSEEVKLIIYAKMSASTCRRYFQETR